MDTSLQPSVAQLSLIEQRVANDAPTPVATYLLWFLLGIFGLHRLYVGRTTSGCLQLLLAVLAIGAFFVSLPLLLLAPIAVLWWVFDLFAIPGMIRKAKDDIRAKMRTQIFYERSDAPSSPLWVERGAID